MLNGISDGPQFSQTSNSHAPTPPENSLIVPPANRILTRLTYFRNHHHSDPSNVPSTEHLFDDNSINLDDQDSELHLNNCCKPSVSTENGINSFSDHPHPHTESKHPKLTASKNKITNHSNNKIQNRSSTNTNDNTIEGSSSYSTSPLPSMAAQIIQPNGSNSNNNNSNVTNNITSMNSSSSLASNSSSTNVSSNSVSNSNSNSSLRLGSSFTASHAHHGSHGHHPLFHSSFSSSSAINGSRQQQEMKRHLNRVRNEQSTGGSNSGSHPSSVGSNMNGATNSYIDNDGNRLRHYSSVGSNNSFRSTDDEMLPTSSAPSAPITGATSAISGSTAKTASRKMSDSSILDSPSRVNRSASSLRMATSVDSQLGGSNNSNNFNNNESNNNRDSNLHYESALNSANNTSNNIDSLLNNNNYTASSMKNNNSSNIPESPVSESRSMSPVISSAGLNASTQPLTSDAGHFQDHPSLSSLSSSQQNNQNQQPVASSSVSVSQLHSSASQPALVSSVQAQPSANPDYHTSAFGYSTPGLTNTQSNGRVGHDTIRTANSSRVKRFGRDLGPPMRALKRESEEGLNANNNGSNAGTPPLPMPSDDLSKKPSTSSIKDREMIDVNQPNNDPRLSFIGSSQSKGPEDGDLPMSYPFLSSTGAPISTSPAPPAAASSTSSKIEIQGLALEGQLSTDEDQRNELGPLPQLDIAGALLQHQNMQAQKENQSPVASFQPNQGNYFGSSSPSIPSTGFNNVPVQQTVPQPVQQPPSSQIASLYQVSPASPFTENSPAAVSLALEDKIERELTLERQHEELRHYLQIQEKLIQDQHKQILMQKQQKEQLEEQAKAKAKAEAEAQAQAKAAQEQQNKQQASNAAAVAAASSGRKQKNLIYVNSQPYQRLELIGRGGSSKVYKAQSSTGKIYAIKRVSCDEDIDDTVLKGFKGEIDLLQRLNEEERVVKLIDYEMRASSIYVVMECGEIDLAHVLNARLALPLDISFVRYYANEMFRCVEAVHKHDIVHSDLKPANFLLVKGMLKIIDFGIANVVPDYTSNVHRDTQIGTPNYMAPEALLDASHVYANASSNSMTTNKDEEVSTNPNYNYRNNRNSIQSIASINPTPQKPKTTKFKVGRPSDVWSCGCIIYQMIYGRPPYGAYQGTQRMLAIMNPKVPITYPRQGLGQIKVPKESIEAIKGCLDRDPTQRLTIEQVVNGAFFNPQAVDRRFIHDLLGHAVKYGADRGNSVTARELEMLTENVWKKIQASNM